MGAVREETSLKKLAEKFAQYQKKSFPDPGDDSDMQDLDEGLLEYGYRVANYISRVLRGEVSRLGRFQRWRRLGKRIERLMMGKPEFAERLREYSEIYERLEELLDMAEALLEERKKEPRASAGLQ